MTIFLGLILGAIVGATLGLIGAGGAILAVPGLVAVLGLSATAATTSSTIIVGSAALAGVVSRRKTGTVDVKVGLTFSAVGIVGTFIGTLLLKVIPENITLVMFAFLMFGAGYAMCCKKTPEPVQAKPKWYLVIIAATFVGILTGLLGIGGGFLIVPALILFLKVPTKIAAGTSLLAITANSLLAFILRYEFWDQIPVMEVAVFTISAISASLILSPIAGKLNANVLKKSFSVVIMLVGVYTLFTNIN
ncbi:MAG: hypothetical protein RJA33_838 [Actinomycetota bacterium]|jgi:uncharacterized membrane protein YfcA